MVELDRETELEDVGRALKKKSIKDLTEIRISPNDPERYFLLGSQLPEPEKTKLLDFLLQNKDVFAWTPYEIPGISPEVIRHKLNVDPKHKPVIQKARRMVIPQIEAMTEDVQKLLETKAIWEVHYPEWLANTVWQKRRMGSGESVWTSPTSTKPALRTASPSQRSTK